MVRITINFDNQTYVNKQRKGKEKRLEVLQAHYVVRLQGSASVWGWRTSGHCARLEPPKSPAHEGNAAKSQEPVSQQFKKVTSQN